MATRVLASSLCTHCSSLGPAMARTATDAYGLDLASDTVRLHPEATKGNDDRVVYLPNAPRRPPRAASTARLPVHFRESRDRPPMAGHPQAVAARRR